MNSAVSNPVPSSKKRSATMTLAAIVVALFASLTLPVGAASAAGSGCQISVPDAQFEALVDSSARHAQIWRLYQAYFLRQPDTSGLAYWAQVRSEGTTLSQIALYFELSDEFSRTYGSLDDSEFLSLIYDNVLCREQDESGFAYWLGLLNSGELSRPEMLILFSESAEYIATTNTAWSYFDSPYNATLAANGYEIRSLQGGQMAVVDYDRVDFKASHERCSVASINGNWFFNPETQNPTAIGFGVIDGQEIPWGVAAGLAERGVFGERIRPYGPVAEAVYTWPSDTNLNSNLATKNGHVLESWLGFQPAEVASRFNPGEWRWAAAGIPLIMNGQEWTHFSNIPTNDYTHYTRRHSFVAFDKTAGLLYFGSTTDMNSRELIDWAIAQGFEDLIKFDGGGSVEFNIGGGAVVAGTPRDVPLWLGIGC